MNSILAAAIGGALGGGGGALLGGLLARLFPDKWRRGVATAVTVVLVIVGSRAAVWYYERDAYAPAMIESQMLADPEAGPMVRAWRDAEPESFQAFLGRVSQSARQGADRDAIISAARSEMIAAAAPRMAHLDDSQMVELIRIAREEYRQLARSNPTKCHPMFMGGAFGDITADVSPDLVRREMAIFQGAFSADMAVQQNVLTGDAFDEAVATLLNSTSVVVGEDVSLLSPGAVIAGREARYCDVVSTLFGQMEAMPAADAAALMRGLRAVS